MEAQCEPAGPTRTSVRMADGRRLLYYDETAGADRSVTDRRELPHAATRSEIRHDPLLDEWVVIAAHRQDRTHLPAADLCPLCPSTPTRPTEIPAADYDVVVFDNRFPSLVDDAPPSGAAGGADSTRRRPGVGACEVVCYTADHRGTLAGLPHRRLRTVVDVWADRTVELGRRPGVEQVFPFENRGEDIGVTLQHPHGQIYAYPFVAPRTARKLASARRHERAVGECLFCAVIADERAGDRVVAEADGWVAFVPYAGRWPFEVHCYPLRHVPDLPALGGAERDGLARLLKVVLQRLDGVFGLAMPYMAMWQQAPVRIDRELAHLHLEVCSPRRTVNKLKYLAGSESGAGVFINDIWPEQAAGLLREAGGAP